MKRSHTATDRRLVPANRKASPTLRIKPVKQTCTFPTCREIARFVVAVAASGDGSIRAARRCCGGHLEETVFWAEGLVEADPRARYALISRWGPWTPELREVSA